MVDGGVEVGGIGIVSNYISVLGRSAAAQNICASIDKLKLQRKKREKNCFHNHLTNIHFQEPHHIIMCVCVFVPIHTHTHTQKKDDVCGSSLLVCRL
jgi:hypothetical protein